MSETFRKVTNGLKRVRRKISGPTNREVQRSANYIKQALIAASPVDSGKFQSSWIVRRNNKRTGVFSSFSIYNRTAYGNVIEYGSDPGSRPWPNPGKKTVFYNGKIYSSQAIGGVYKNANLKGYAVQLANNIHAGLKVTL